jgi:hypothetical protein
MQKSILCLDKTQLLSCRLWNIYNYLYGYTGNDQIDHGIPKARKLDERVNHRSGSYQSLVIGVPSPIGESPAPPGHAGELL